MIQELVWLPEGSNAPGQGRGGVPLACPRGRPVRVWTLYGHTDEQTRPELPYAPRHHHGAFIEDWVHDWNWSPSRPEELRYYSRATEGGCWVLMEYLPLESEPLHGGVPRCTAMREDRGCVKQCGLHRGHSGSCEMCPRGGSAS